MLPNEQKMIEDLNLPYNKFFVPLLWSTSLISKARKEGRIRDDVALKTLLDELNTYRGNLGTLLGFNWISIPLVYTQVVTIAVYTYFLSTLIGSQFLLLDSDEHGNIVPTANVTTPAAKTTGDQWKFDVYVPVFMFLMFFFYMGWLKVAESMVNPFGGDDDDDFEINFMIDRNMKMSYLVVDEMHQVHPELQEDAYWDTKSEDVKLPTAKDMKSLRLTEKTPKKAKPTKAGPPESMASESPATASMAEEGRAKPTAAGVMAIKT